MRYGTTTDGFYIKGGQFYLPFGWRLQDQSAFVREDTGISMSTPDKGVELGYEHTAWSAQFDFTNGAANACTGSGYQVTSQVVYTMPIWRVGIAGASTQSSAGDQRMGGLFAGLKTGPIAWLAEGDIIHDDSLQARLPPDCWKRIGAFARDTILSSPRSTPIRIARCATINKLDTASCTSTRRCRFCSCVPAIAITSAFRRTTRRISSSY